MKVSIFTTCLIDQFFPGVAVAMVRLLKHLGIEVDYDPRQTCCGQPAFNSGYLAEARQVARYFLKTYHSCDLIVVPSGSCAAMIKVSLPRLFETGSSERELAKDVARRTHELSEFLVNVLGIRDTGASFPEVVTYHDSCHQLRELGIFEQPRILLRSVSGLILRELEDGYRCCGFGGTFSVHFDEISSALGGEKLEQAQKIGARYIISNDVSCLMHLQGLIDRQGLTIETRHLAEILVEGRDTG